jgi:hypothetical protein
MRIDNDVDVVDIICCLSAFVDRFFDFNNLSLAPRHVENQQYCCLGIEIVARISHAKTAPPSCLGVRERLFDLAVTGRNCPKL